MANSIWDDLVESVGGAARKTADVGKKLKAGVIDSVGSGVGMLGTLQEAGERAINRGLGADLDGKAEGIRSIADGLAKQADAARASVSQPTRQASAASTSSGNVFKGEGSFGEAPSLIGKVANAAEGFGSAVAPAVATLVVGRIAGARAGMAAGTAVGGLMAGGAAEKEERQRIETMDAAQRLALPRMQELMAGGMSEQAAAQQVASEAGLSASLPAAAVGGLGGLVTGGLITAPGQALVKRMVGNSAAARIGATGALGAGEEGVQEVGEGVAQRFGASLATGEADRELGEDSFANLEGGIMAGGPMSAAGAAVSEGMGPAGSTNAASEPAAQVPDAPAVVNPARGVVSRAVAAGAAQGAIQNVVIEPPEDFALASPPKDMAMPPDTMAGMQQQAPAAAYAAQSQGIPRLGPALLSQKFQPLGLGYGSDAGPRMEGETPKSYAKRVIDALPAPAPEQLPNDPARYFTLDKADAVVPLAQLLPSKGAEIEASANATKRMAAAAEGLIDRRDPIDVRANADGTYTVVDGNGMLGAALQVGLSGLPVRVVEADAGREGWRNDRGYHPPEVAEALTRTYEVAAREKAIFDETNARIAEKLALKKPPAVVALKGRTRAEQKLVGYRGDVSKLSDLVRTTFEVDSIDEVPALLETLQAEYPNNPDGRKLKHYLSPEAQTPYAGGYRDSKMVATLPDGTRAEVQINLKPMLEAKKRVHALYADWRKIAEAVENEGRRATPEEQARLDELDGQMRAVYEPAWAAVLSASKTAGSIGTPSSATATLPNTLPSGTSNASTSSTLSGPREIATGTPLTSKNFVPSGNATTGVSPAANAGGVNTQNAITDSDFALGRDDRAPGWNRQRATTFGMVVAPKPGTKVQRGDEVAVYDRAIDGANQPPLAAPVQREPDIGALTERAAAVIKRPAAQAALRKAFGIKGLKMTTLRGSYEGEPELSWHIEAAGLTDVQAREVAQFLGMAFSQDAVIVTKPDPVGPEEDSIPTIELFSTNDAKLDDSVFDAVTAELRAQGIDYSEAREGRAIRVLHFGDEAGLEQLGVIMATAAQTHGLEVGHLHTRSDLYEAQDYRRNLGGGGDQAVQGLRPEVFGALVDHFLVPHTRAAAAAGYRFDADRYASRFGLEAQELATLKARLSKYEPRSSVPVLTGAEAIPGRAKGAPKPTNVDAAWFLQNRAAAFGVIKPTDRSSAAKETIAESLAQEIEYQIAKPEGKQAIGWYDRQLKTALATIAELHPEIGTDPNAEFVFKALLATTSQNLSVVKNFEVALALYERYLAGGQFDMAGVSLPGKAAPIAKQNVEKLQAMIDERGLEATAAFMREKHTVRQLKSIGFKDVSGRLDEQVRGWMVFGPKIGSFGNNLDGDFDTLTADLWFSRTWNRVLGTMFKYSAKAEANTIGEFREELARALEQPGTNPIVDSLTPEERAQLGTLEADFAVAERMHREFAKGYKDRSPINRKSKAWVENVKHLQDVPRGDPERRWQNEVMREVQAKVAARTGEQVSIADLQALLWYQEKELFRLLGAANKSSAPLDYQDAAKAAIAQARPAALGRAGDNDAVIVRTGYPLGTEALLRKIEAAAPGARVSILAGDLRSASRVAIETPFTAALQAKLLEQPGIREVFPGAMPTGENAMRDELRVPPRFALPAAVTRSGKYAALTPDLREKVDGALAGLKARGYPANWIQRASFFFAHDAANRNAAQFYLFGEFKGGVSIRADRLQGASRQDIEADLAHELAHAVDYDKATETFLSLTSPRFAANVNAEGGIDYTGDVISELFAAYRDRTQLAEDLAYPFARNGFSVDTIKTEAFARSVELFFARPGFLKKHAPTAYAMVEEMINAERQSAGQTGSRPEGVRAALRTTRGGQLSTRVPANRALENDRAVDREGGTRLAVDRAGERSGDGRGAGAVTDTQEFKRWFGDSKVVDVNGAPLVVYHGTAKEFDAFDPRARGDNYDNEVSRSGFFFTDEWDKAHSVASTYADELDTQPRVIDAYLSMQNPLEIDASNVPGYGDGPNQIADMLYDAEKAGHDGAIIRGWEDGMEMATQYVVFRPEQIKSATANNGEFDPEDPSILANEAPVANAFDGWTMPSWDLTEQLNARAGSRLERYKAAAAVGGDKLRVALQDYFLPVKRVQDAIVERGGAIDEDADVYGREELYYGRAGERLRKIEDEHVKPLIAAMHDSKTEQADLELYLYAKFAPSRNARIASINPAMPDGGSGMSNADAQQVLADFESAGKAATLEALATRVREMNALRIDILEAGGLLSSDEAALWREEPDYVPLKGVAEGTDEPGTRLKTGQGFSIGGREAHRALGRKSRASDLLANTIAQVEQAVIRAEKNRVAVALLRLAERNPNEDLWTVDKAEEKPQLSPGGEVVWRKNNLQKLADNVVLAKVDGVEHFVTLHDKRLATSMKNMGAAKMGAFLRAFSSINRFLSLTRTMLAPEFVLANFARDLQTASINLTADDSAAMAARVVKDVPVAIRAMYAQLRGKSRGGEWSRWAQEFADEGGMTNFVAQRSIEEQQAKLQGLLKDATGGSGAVEASWIATKKLARGTFEFIETVNGSVENATRLATYANARRSGMSKQAAARIAKNVTVNFNRKGEVGSIIGALYLFYNASVQGTARFLRAMKSPKVQKLMAATAVMGYGLAAMNRAVGGEDEDGEDRWDKIPDWEKARNLIIFIPGTDGETIKIPLPYTYNLPFLIGSEVEGMVKSKREPSHAAANIAEAILTSFNPIGEYDLEGDSSVSAAKFLSPTAVDPMVDIATNTNFFGAPINPERSPFDKTPEPDSQNAFASTNPVARWIATTLNSATGGNAVESGLIDVSPGSMVYVFDYLTGGTGSFVERGVAASLLAAQGEPVPANKVPFLRVFKGELNDRRVTDTFYRLRDDVNLKAELAELGKTAGFDSPEARREARMGQRLARRLKVTERRLRTVRQKRKAAQLAGDKEAIKRFEARERAIQLKFNQAYFEALDSAEGAE